jgi:hypothetical protein
MGDRVGPIVLGAFEYFEIIYCNFQAIRIHVQPEDVQRSISSRSIRYKIKINGGCFETRAHPSSGAGVNADTNADADADAARRQHSLFEGYY